MLKVIAALGRFEARQTGTDRRPQHLVRPTPRLSEDRLQLRKRQLDRIQVGTVFRKEPQAGAGRFNRAPDGRALVTRQVVHDDDIAGRERRDQDLLDVGKEAGAINWPVEHARGGEARDAERREKGSRVPAPVRGVIGNARAVQPAPIPSDQIRSDATFIEKYQARGIERRGRRVPGRPGERDVSARVFGGAYRFF